MVVAVQEFHLGIIYNCMQLMFLTRNTEYIYLSANHYNLAIQHEIPSPSTNPHKVHKK